MVVKVGDKVLVTFDDVSGAEELVITSLGFDDGTIAVGREGDKQFRRLITFDQIVQDEEDELPNLPAVSWNERL